MGRGRGKGDREGRGEKVSEEKRRCRAGRCNLYGEGEVQ